MLFRYPVIDSHIHVLKTDFIEEIETIAKEGNYEKYTLLSSAGLPQLVYGNLVIALAKKKRPERVYGYAMFHMKDVREKPNAEEMLKQAQYYHDIGFDGIKMLDGKPNVRKMRGVALDDACYDPLFSYMEQVKMPVLYHSNDPVEFWDRSKAPAWALDAGFVYTNDITWEQIRDETIGILKKHPKLHLTIAHMFFLSNGNNLELAKELLDTYENLMFDLTPGWEMFEGFAKDSDGWKKFFQDYSDRLVYGTDICDEKGISILDPLRRCLETDEVFEKSGVMCYGLKLPDDILKKIYRENYQTKIHPEGPGKIQMDILEKYKNNLEKYMETLSPEEKKEAQKETDKIWKMILTV